MDRPIARDGGHTVHVTAGEMNEVMAGMGVRAARSQSPRVVQREHRQRRRRCAGVPCVVSRAAQGPANHALHEVPRDGWARITRWNNSSGPATFCVDVRGSLSTFLRRAGLGRKVNRVQDTRIVQESSADDTGMSIRLRRTAFIAEPRDPFNAAHDVKETWISILSREPRTGVKAIECALASRCTLCRKHPVQPLTEKVSIALCHLLCTCTRASGDLLVRRARAIHSPQLRQKRQ